MGLRDDELRRLIEIEQRLLQDDPGLSRRLGKRGPQIALKVLSAALAATASVVGGLMAMVLSVESDSTGLLAFGTVLVVGVPALLLGWWHLKSRSDR
ncbi:DUF3040 domain-containing protein [Amycolatopsis thermoflava]|uniref:DUF3040 domain-containing protein n=1 Tax=Amycolatopsis thermoflava TaxID=84480 RepID=UPI003EB9F950